MNNKTIPWVIILSLVVMFIVSRLTPNKTDDAIVDKIIEQVAEDI